MMRSTRGAARVGIVWIIVVGVLFLVSIAFAFVASSDLAAEVEQREAAQASARNAQNAADDAAQYARGLSQAVGWYDPESADPRADTGAISSAVEDLRATFSDLGDEDGDFQKVLPKMIAAYNARGRELAELRTRIQSLENELSVAQSTVAQVSGEKDNRISQLMSQLADETQNAASRQEELERRLAAANNQLNETDLKLRQAQNDMHVTERGFVNEKNALLTRIDSLAQTARFADDPFSRYPDGKVIEVSKDLEIGWIDLGSEQRLVRGIRFRVQSATPGLERFKGFAEVISVDANMAEVRFSEIVDAFDPIVPGDVLINPLYDPTGGRNAILVGRFSGTFNRKELTLLLERMGIIVQEKLELTTHFMIVGQELYNDPETGEPLEDPILPSDLAVYKDAEAKRVQVIPLQDIREFFRIDTRPGAASGS